MKNWYRVMVGELDYIVMEILDVDLSKYDRVQVKIEGRWYPALRRSR